MVSITEYKSLMNLWNSYSVSVKRFGICIHLSKVYVTQSDANSLSVQLYTLLKVDTYSQLGEEARKNWNFIFHQELLYQQ